MRSSAKIRQQVGAVSLLSSFVIVHPQSVASFSPLLVVCEMFSNSNRKFTYVIALRDRIHQLRETAKILSISRDGERSIEFDWV